MYSRHWDIGAVIASSITQNHFCWQEKVTLQSPCKCNSFCLSAVEQKRKTISCSYSSQGHVRESGDICPSFILIYGCEGVNNGKIQYGKVFGPSGYGHITWDFQTSPCVNSCTCNYRTCFAWYYAFQGFHSTGHVFSNDKSPLLGSKSHISIPCLLLHRHCLIYLHAVRAWQDNNSGLSPNTAGNCLQYKAVIGSFMKTSECHFGHHFIRNFVRNFLWNFLWNGTSGVFSYVKFLTENMKFI